MGELILHRICLDCWRSRHGDAPLHRVHFDHDEPCCWCGKPRWCGYVLWEPREHGPAGCAGVSIEHEASPVDASDLR